MSKLEDYWKDLSTQAKAKGIKKSVDDIERIWRKVAADIDKEGIKPDNMRYNQMLINRTREKVMKESKFEEYLNEDEYGEHTHNMTKEKHHKDCQCRRCKPSERPCACKHCENFTKVKKA